MYNFLYARSFVPIFILFTNVILMYLKLLGVNKSMQTFGNRFCGTWLWYLENLVT